MSSESDRFEFRLANTGPSEMPQAPQVAIIYAAYRCEPYLDDMVRGLAAVKYPRDRLRLVLVTPEESEEGALSEAGEERLRAAGGQDIPQLTIIREARNRGFAAAVNAGLRWAAESGYSYGFLHNTDGYLDVNGIAPLVDQLERDPESAMAQPLVLLHPEHDLVNTAGTALHFTLFGYCDGYRCTPAELKLPAVKEIACASGAAVLIRLSTCAEHGFLDEDFFLYCEDVEFSLRLRLAGYRTILVSEARFFHKYDFGRNPEKLYWLERNRLALLLLTLRARTLAVLTPILLCLELGLVVLALRRGWLKTRLRVYGYWLRPANWKLWAAKRRRIQATRCIGDRRLLKLAVCRISFPERAAESRLLRYVGNPVFAAYYWLIVRSLIWW